jgi:Stage II sporulation protein/Family of unknown function (DUF5719)
MNGKRRRKFRVICSALTLVGSILLICSPALPGWIPAQGPPRGAGLAGSGVVEIPDTVKVLMPDNSVRTMNMDEYLKGVVPAEMSPSWPLNALCAQAVAARCYATTAHRHPEQGADVCTTTHCQVWQDRHYDRTDLAVDSTHKVAALYRGEVIEAFYFGHCDGHTRDAEEVGWGYVPYCLSVGCPCGFTQMYGHGVGMCQEGARVLAQNGWDYKDILKHYYSGVEVRNTEPAAQNWYFAEGTTRPDFVTYVCLANPGGDDASVAVRYMLEGGSNKDVVRTVKAHSRLTIDTASDVGRSKDFSIEVNSRNGVPVVAERPMYFNYKGAWTGGSDTVGSPETQRTLYFAEGTTRPGFDTYLCIGNPSDTEAQITVSYMVEQGKNNEKKYVVKPRARKTLEVAREIGREKDFSCRLSSTNGVGIVAERPMYFNFAGEWSGGHTAMGAASPGSSWYFSEGTTRPGFRTYLCLSNPNAAPADVKVSYLIDGGENVEAAYEVGPLTRKTIDASQDVGNGRDFSCRVTSENNVGVVAERPMYFNYGGAWTGGSDAVGASGPGPRWYFAEGTARPNFVTYISLANPTDNRADVKITYIKTDGTTSQQSATVEPLSRTTVSANDFLGTVDDGAHDFAIKVESVNNVGIVAERPMYFNYRGAWSGGHDAMGY